MSIHNKLIVTVVIIHLSFITTIAQAGNSSQQGEWQVANVFINTETERTINYQNNDDRLVGRFLSLSPQEITTTLPGGAYCYSPTWTQKSITLDSWIAETQSIPEKGAAKAYQLGIDGNAQAETAYVNCATGNFANGDPGGNASLAFVDQRLLLNWTDGTIILLKPLDKASKPQASFDCAKASTASEKAICGDRELAALDSSVTRSYRYFRNEAANLGNKSLETQL